MATNLVECVLREIVGDKPAREAELSTLALEFCLEMEVFIYNSFFYLVFLFKKKGGEERKAVN